MIASIVEKLSDALSMFWQALDFGERRVVVAVGVYLAVLTMVIVYRMIVALVVNDIVKATDETPKPKPKDEPETA